MNVFPLHPDPVVSASYLVDDHVAYVTVCTKRPPLRSCKMALEACQLLSNAHWFGVVDRLDILRGPKENWLAPYRPTHMNHPWSVAARSSVEAYQFVWEHARAILNEHEYRTGKRMDTILRALEMLETPPKGLGSGDWKIPVCRAGLEPVYVDSLDEAVRLYRGYYRGKIEKMPRFTKRSRPEWA